MALFLVAGLVAANFYFSVAKVDGKRGVLGGPANIVSLGRYRSGVMASAGAFAGGPIVADLGPGNIQGYGSNNSSLQGSLLASVTSPLGSSRAQTGILVYKVKKGDNLSVIAANFGVSVQTILGANPDLKARTLRVGQELNVLPVSGVLYHVKDGETPESVAAIFNMTVSQLREFNRTVDFNSFGAQTTLIIPGVSPLNTAVDSRVGQLPNLKGYFTMPTEGFNWGILHRWNAVDIANNCGTKVNAAAEGLVIDFSEDDWSYGYGHFVFVEHPNGTKTRYAHLAKTLASVGDYVKQGQQIGTMGATGDATGCHLHFEVYDAKNPFAK